MHKLLTTEKHSSHIPSFCLRRSTRAYAHSGNAVVIHATLEVAATLILGCLRADFDNPAEQLKVAG